MLTRSAGAAIPNPARAGFFAWFGCAVLALSCLAAASASAATLVVGTDAPLATLADAVRQAHDGDTILVRSGEYRGDVALIEQKRLTIRGIGQRAVFIADGRDVEGKAMLVVRDGDIEIENLEFRGARVPDGNGAAIRFEQGRLLLRRCAFFDNQNGVLTANFAAAELIIEDSEFAQAPQVASPLPHLLYVGRIASLKVSGSRFHQGHVGHLLKSRARRTELAYNLIVDGADGRASYEVDLPNGGDALLLGNVIGQSAHSENPVLVAYGAEGNAWPHSRLRLAHNTLVNDGLRPAWFLRVWSERLPPHTRVQAFNNLSVGVGVFAPAAAGGLAHNAADFVGNAAATRAMLAAVDTQDFALAPGSKLRGTGVDASTAFAGELAPRFEFTLPVGTRALAPPLRWSPGALQR